MQRLYLYIILTSPPGGGEVGGALSMLVPVGILPCLSGVGLYFWGRALVRGARERGE